MIIFDCDGVLVDSESVYIDVELEHLAAVGVRCDRSDYMRRFMGLAPARWRAELADAVHARAGRPLPDGFFATLDAALDRALRSRLRALPGVRDVVAAVTGPRCVASSTPRPQLAWKLRHTGFDRLFGRHVFSADEVEHGKPAPDLFLHAASSVGVEPSACIVVEDSANGVRAGVAAGMQVIGFAGAGHCLDGHVDMLAAAGASLAVDDVDGLRHAIDRLSARSQPRRVPGS